MTAQANPIYALLIGIDNYNPNRMYKSLQGCVRDINLVDSYLQTAVQPQRTWKLTSANPDAADSTAPATDSLPTYANIVAAFQEVTATANPGEIVYIHYAGHGGRATTVYADLKGEGQNDEGIVPMDIGDLDGRYLRDVEMATLLKRMTDKGLVVTVVLDSCHSGGATRGDSQVRSSEAGVDTAARSADSLVADRSELVANWQQLTQGNATSAAGLPEARDYVLLAACRPNEYAYEYAVEGKDRHGALTYWMINTLTSSASSGQPLNYKLLYDRVQAQIQSKFPQQLPMILGESTRLVFGREQWSTPYTVAVMSIDPAKTQVTLNAGLAQGLSRGTQFAIYPLNTTEFTDPQRVAIVEVTKIEAAGAVAKILSSSEGGLELKAPIEPGAPAVMTTAPVELIRRVRLFDQKQAGDQEDQLPPEWVEQQTAALAAVRQALAGNGWLTEVQGNDQESHYQVAVGRSGEYEICIATPINNLRPALKIDDPEAAQTVVQRLVHLAKYQAVQGLNNPGSKLSAGLEVQMLTNDEQPFPDPQAITVQAGEVVCLRLTNRGLQPLKVAVLDLDPTWAISQLPLQGIEAPFYNLDAGETQDLRLSFAVPEGLEYQKAKEILKVFAIQKGLADFRWLTLPSLDQQLQSRGNDLNAGLQQIAAQSVTRGEAEGINPLNQLLATIGADLEQPPQISRAATVVLDPNQDWATKQIQIVIEQPGSGGQ